MERFLKIILLFLFVIQIACTANVGELSFEQTEPPTAPSSVVVVETESLTDLSSITWVDGAYSGADIDRHEVSIVKGDGSSVTGGDYDTLNSGESFAGLSLDPDTEYKALVRAIDVEGNISTVAESSTWTTYCYSDWSLVTLALDPENADGNVVFTDVSTDGNTISTQGDAIHSNTESQFGTTAAYFDGSGDYLEISSSTSFDNDTEFAVDFWAFFDGAVTEQTIISNLNTTGWEVSINSSGFLEVTFVDSGSTTLTSLAAVSRFTFNHIAISNDLTTVSLYINGVLQDSDTYRSTVSDGNLRIGTNIADDEPFNGYIESLRITKGSNRFDSSFTPRSKSVLCQDP